MWQSRQNELKSEAISDSSRHPKVGASGNWQHKEKCLQLLRADKMKKLNSDVNKEKEIQTSIESRQNVNIEEGDEKQHNT